MAAPAFLFDGPDDAPLTFVFAHGAGAPMDSAFMNAIARGLSGAGLRVARFEFPYMAARRVDGRRRPPDRAQTVLAAWRDAIAALGAPRFAIGGKSMGGRFASQIADGSGARGLVCFSYPFHPPGKPEKPRTEHLASLATPTMILQGERDPFGDRADVAGYALSPRIAVHWLADGDHDLEPRRASGRTGAQNLADAAAAAARFLARL